MVAAQIRKVVIAASGGALVTAAAHALWRAAAPAGPPLSPGSVWMGNLQGAAFDLLSLAAPVALCGWMLLSGVRAVRWAGWTIASLLISMYALSWCVFLRMNEFLGVEGVRFVFYNFTQLLAHILQTSPSSLVLLSAVFIIPPVLLPAALRGAGLLLGRLTADPVPGRIAYGFSLAMLAVTAGVLFLFPSLPAHTRLSPLSALVGDILAPPKAPRAGEERGLLLRWKPRGTTPAPARKIADGKGRAVIVITVESMRPDALQDGHIMPNLFGLKADSLLFPNAFAPSNETDYAWPAIMSSHYPLRSAQHHYYPRRITYPRVFIYDVLRERGYATALFSAQNEQWGGMRHYLDTGGLDYFYDANASPEGKYLDPHDQGFGKWAAKLGMAGKIDDAVVIDQALSWMARLDGGPFFVAINLQRTHFPYTWPDQFRPPFGPAPLDFEAIFGRYPLDKVPVLRNRYNNALAYVDAQIGRLLAFLKERGLYDGALIVVLGDHGEAFYEGGVSCHAAALDMASTRTLMVVKVPQGAFKGNRQEPVQTIDVPPTICRLLGLPAHPSFQGRDLLAPRPPGYPIFMTVNTLLANQDAVLAGRWKLVRDYARGRQRLYDVQKDPWERRDVAAAFPQKAGSLGGALTEWREELLAYYADPDRQRSYYPPEVVWWSAP